jgi:hypothetical protein
VAITPFAPSLSILDGLEALGQAGAFVSCARDDSGPFGAFADASAGTSANIRVCGESPTTARRRSFQNRVVK